MTEHLQVITRLSHIIAATQSTPASTADEAMALYKKVCETHLTPLFTTMKEFAMLGLSEEERKKADKLFNDITGINIVMKKVEEKVEEKVEATLPIISDEKVDA